MMHRGSGQIAVGILGLITLQDSGYRVTLWEMESDAAAVITFGWHHAHAPMEGVRSFQTRPNTK